MPDFDKEQELVQAYGKLYAMYGRHRPLQSRLQELDAKRSALLTERECASAHNLLMSLAELLTRRRGGASHIVLVLPREAGSRWVARYVLTRTSAGSSCFHFGLYTPDRTIRYLGSTRVPEQEPALTQWLPPLTDEELLFGRDKEQDPYLFLPELPKGFQNFLQLIGYLPKYYIQIPQGAKPCPDTESS